MTKHQNMLRNSNNKNALLGLVLVIISAIAGFYLGRTYSPSASSNELASNLNHDVNTTQAYNNNEYGFSFQYPDGSKIDYSSNPDLVVEVSPPAEYYLAETQLTVKAFKETNGQSIDNMIKNDLVDASKNLYTGVLKEEIDGLPAKRFYTITCPELGSNCAKTNKYYLSANGYTYIITTTLHTDTDYKPINEDVTEDIISTINFTN